MRNQETVTQEWHVKPVAPWVITATTHGTQGNVIPNPMNGLSESHSCWHCYGNGKFGDWRIMFALKN